MPQLKDLMSKDVKLVDPETSIKEAALMMRDGDFGLMPVGDVDRMIGTISDRDIAIRAVALDMGPETKVRDVMTAGVAWAYETDSVDHAVRIMSQQQVRRLPVVDENKRLVGIVALADLAVKDSEQEASAEALSEISKPA